MLNKSCAAWRFVDEGALKPLLALALLGPLLLGLVLAAPAHAQKKRDDAPVTVITAPVIETANRQRFDGVGTGVAQKRVDLYPNVAETVTAIGFKAGERVAKDALLIQLDDRAEKLALSLAEIQLKEAKSLLGRFTQAAKDGAVPDSEVDAARTEFEAAKIALEQARLASDMRQLRAPFAGVMGLPQVEIGDRVDTSTLIATLDDRTVLHVDFEIPEALAKPLLSDQGERVISATTPAYGTRRFDAKVAALDSRVHPTRRTLKVRAALDNSDDDLRPGMSFRVRFAIEGASYPATPEIAVQWEREGSFIWLARDGEAQKVRVEIITRRDGLALLKGTVKDGDAVVIEGLQRLRPGMAVAASNERAE